MISESEHDFYKNMEYVKEDQFEYLNFNQQNILDLATHNSYIYKYHQNSNMNMNINPYISKKNQYYLITSLFLLKIKNI